VKAINHCDVEKSCRAVGEEMGVGRTQIMNILKRKRVILDDFENNASSSMSCCWKLYFCLLNIFIYLFVCFIQINYIRIHGPSSSNGVRDTHHVLKTLLLAGKKKRFKKY
jgi:hypothetical protein